jgi:UDP-N-acetylmuramoylalanine-D-glutamate ligase
MQLNLDILHRFANQTVIILGLGREGKSTYQFLRTHGPDTTRFILADTQPLAKLDPFWQEQLTRTETAVAFRQLGSEALDWATIDQVAITPGISDPVLFEAYGAPRGISITSNTELFFALTTTVPPTELLVIGVTGTKGKSTTTAGIYHVLHQSGLPSVLGGNIGIPPLDVLKQLLTLSKQNTLSAPIYAVLELSCHQLARSTYSPDIAVVQAITPEHLDYYPSFEEYLESKTTICRYQTNQDVVLFNSDSETARYVAGLSQGRQQGFSLETSPIDPTKVKIPGKHNVLNVTPAILVAQMVGIDHQTALEKVYSFTGLPHRLQLIGEQKSRPHNITPVVADAPLTEYSTSDTIRYYNDSLSTTPEAAMAAINSFDQPAVLIAGGYDRGLEYAELGSFLVQASQDGKIRGLVYFAPSGERMVEAVKKAVEELQILGEIPDQNTLPKKELFPMVKVETMAEAVAEANIMAQPGDVVLLSPASASFGRFKDYAERGNQFAEEVKKQL